MNVLFQTSPSLFPFCAVPTVAPHTAETSGRLPETHDPLHFPSHRSELLTSFPAKPHI